MTNLTIYVNTGADDIERGESGAEFTEVSVANDTLIFSSGSAIVADGESIPSSSELTQAGVLTSEVADVEVEKYFLADVSAVQLKEIFNAGNLNKRYVFCFAFDDETATEPTLELWDDTDMDSSDLYSLGAGTPADSWWKGLTTTAGLPGVDWANDGATIKLAGGADGNFLWLNDENGALSVADDLYCNLTIVIPTNPNQSGLEQPVIVIKYTSN